jgi:hypothetical protein
MQLEGTAAGATAIFEMLIHTHGKVIKIFPATPAVWADASFRDVPQPGGFRIGAVRSGGKTQAVDIVSLRGGRITVDVPDRASMILRRSGRDKVVSFPFEMHMSAGETLSLVADNE